MSQYVPAALRTVIAERARRRCEYCLLDEDDSFFPHEPDHIIATKHGGDTVEENLAWACFLCNRFKGSDIASIDFTTGEVVRLFHPRRDAWQKHFRLNADGTIAALSPQGRATERLLRFNLSENVETRRLVLERGLPPRLDT